MFGADRIAVVVASLANGGVGKMRVHLVNEFARLGYPVDLLIARDDGPYLASLHPEVRIVRLPTSHALTGVFPLAYYLWRARPAVVLTQRVRVTVATLRARRLAQRLLPRGARLYATVNTNVSIQLRHFRSAKQRKQLEYLRRYYLLADGVIAISQGVAEDVAGILGQSPASIPIAPNPVVTPDLARLAQAPVDHPWLQPGQPPVILGVGRLEPQKDFTTLIRAFAEIRRQRPSRLILLGEGGQRRMVESLAAELGVREAIELPGFVANPYAYMSKAALFVLSSAWEGFGNALAEALAVGTPVVSTDCPSGPREILQDGRYGPLVPVGNASALARAMLETLERPLAADLLRQASERYTVESSAREYLKVFGLRPGPRLSPSTISPVAG
jgi:glycosyltransferase involved in cell wall biosynthesis